MTARPGRRDQGAVSPLLAVAVGVVLVAGVVGPVLAAAMIAPLGTTLGTPLGSGVGPPGGCGAAGTGQRVAGITLDAEQLGHAATIVTVTARRRLPAHAAVVAIATAYQESRLRNLTHGDAAGPDSAGLFQQRPSAGWGTRAQVLDPLYATGAFLDRLVQVPGWASLPLTRAAQAVQNSAFATAYAPWQELAAGVVARLWPSARATATTAATATATAAAAATVVAPVSSPVCPDVGGVDGVHAIGTTRPPAGFEVTGSPAGQVAVRYALAQLGKPYRWAAAGPDAFDCSGLTMTAWAVAGVALPHYTGDQVHRGSPEPVDLSRATGGDLVFLSGSGSAVDPGHVGMIAGRVPASGGQPARLFLVQAPRTGATVTLTPVSAWAGQIVAVRHIG